MKASWSALLFQISVTTHPVAVGPPARLTMPAGQSPVPSGLIPSFSFTAQYWSDPTPSNAKTIPYDIGPPLATARLPERQATVPAGRGAYRVHARTAKVAILRRQLLGEDAAVHRLASYLAAMLRLGRHALGIPETASHASVIAGYVGRPFPV